VCKKEYMEEDKKFQEVNIIGLWNQNIYDSIQKLQDFERICRDGAVSIMEYLNIAPQRKAEIQYQYLRMIVSETGILLGNARARIDKTFFLKSKIQLRKIKNVIDLEPEKLVHSTHNQQSHSSEHYLTEDFYSYLYNLTLIREGIINELQDILFGVKEGKMTGMEKTQEVLRP